MDLLMPAFGLLFWMTVVFLIVFFILKKAGFPAIIKMVNDRKEYIDDSLKKAHEANEKLAKPKLTEEQILFYLHKFRVLDMSKQSHRQRLIDTFINRIYLYDDKLVITFNHKDGAKTITLNDIETALAEKESGSDLVSSDVPKKRGC